MSTATVVSPKKKSTKVHPAKWDDNKTRCLLEILDEEICSGNRPAGVFSKSGWSNIVAKFNERMRLDYNKDQLKNRFDNLRREFTKWEKLIGKETGLGWDHQKRTLSAPPEWWEEKAKIDPAILKYRDGGPIHLELLQKVYGGTTATGYYAYIPGQTSVHTNDAENSQQQPDDILDFTVPPYNTVVPPIQSPLDAANSPNSPAVVFEFDPAITPTTTPSSQPAVSHKRPRVSSSGKMSAADKFLAGMETVSISMRENAAVFSRFKPLDDEKISYDAALAMLKEIPGMTPENPLFLKGVHVLEDKMKQTAFKHMLDFGGDGVRIWLASLKDV